MTESEHISSFLTYIQECATRLHIACADEQEANKQTQDILHRLELQPDSYHTTAQLGKTLRKVRQNRRIAKDMRERLAVIDEWTVRNAVAIKSLERLLGDLRKIERNQNNRLYVPRTDILEEKHDHP